jgi:hypothetical protein
VSGAERAVAECGQWWFLCGLSIGLLGYWIGSIVGLLIWFIVGYCHAHHPTPQAGEQEQP